MTIFEMMKILENCNDISVKKNNNGNSIQYHITIEDFAGYDEDDYVIERLCQKPGVLNKLLDTLEEQALSADKNLKVEYYFKDFSIRVSLASLEC